MKNTHWLLLPALLGLGVAQAQTCKSAISQTTPDADFILQNGGTEALHKTTGLIWKRCLEGLSYDSATQNCTGSATSFTWQAAMQQADSTWRVPNIKELASIVEQSCHNLSINRTIFPNWFSPYVWSSSVDADNSNEAWGVDFDNGYSATDNRSYTGRVWLVRGGQ